MTEREAIKELSYDDTVYGGKCTEEVRIVAIQALEKQVPKKPLRIPTDDSCLYYELRCPCCDAYISGIIEMHHCKCGQALDWT